MSVPACRVLFQHEVGFKTSKQNQKLGKSHHITKRYCTLQFTLQVGTRSSQEGRLDGYGAARGVIASFGAGVGGVGSRRV